MTPNRKNIFQSGADDDQIQKESAEVLRPAEVVVLSDLHGSMGAFNRALIDYGCIEDPEGPWIGGSKRLVLLGDMIDDRENIANSNALMIIDRINELRAGGANIEVLAGNHEGLMLKALYGGQFDLMNWIKVSNGGLSTINEVLRRFGRPVLTHEALDYEQIKFAMDYLHKYYGPFFESLNITTQVDDTLCVHAGIGPGFASNLQQWGVGGVNRSWRGALVNLRKGNSRNFDGFSTVGRARSRTGGARYGGPLWFDFMLELEDRDSCDAISEREIAYVAGVLKSMGVNRVVCGHSALGASLPVISERFKPYGIVVVNVDIGVSYDYRKVGGVQVNRNGSMDTVTGTQTGEKTRLCGPSADVSKKRSSSAKAVRRVVSPSVKGKMAPGTARSDRETWNPRWRKR